MPAAKQQKQRDPRTTVDPRSAFPLQSESPLIAGSLVASTIPWSPQAVNEGVPIPVENLGDNSPCLLTTSDCLWTTAPMLGTGGGRTKFLQARDQPVRCGQLVDREKIPADWRATTGFPLGANQTVGNRHPDSFGAVCRGDAPRPLPAGAQRSPRPGAHRADAAPGTSRLPARGTWRQPPGEHRHNGAGPTGRVTRGRMVGEPGPGDGGRQGTHWRPYRGRRRIAPPTTPTAQSV
jgi:hypothetical protein